MKKIVIILSIFLFFFSLFFSCESIVKDTKTYNAFDATNALSKLAPVFNEVFRENPGFVKMIKQEAEKRFDGTLDVLFESVQNLTLEKGGKTFKELLAAKIVNKGENESFDELISKIPYFNLYVFEPEVKSLTKGSEENVIVCANRYDVDDMSPQYIITGYDIYGNEYQFNKDEQPDITCIVLGVNERVENLKYYQNLKNMGNNNACYLYKVYCDDDKEPWIKGPAEIFSAYLYLDSSANVKKITLKDLVFFDYVKKWYDSTNSNNQLPLYLFKFDTSLYGNIIVCFYIEDDFDWFGNIKHISIAAGNSGGNFDIEFDCTSNFLGKNFTIYDDYMGDFVMYASDPDQVTYSTGNVISIIGH